MRFYALEIDKDHGLCINTAGQPGQPEQPGQRGKKERDGKLVMKQDGESGRAQ